MLLPSKNPKDSKESRWLEEESKRMRTWRIMLPKCDSSRKIITGLTETCCIILPRFPSFYYLFISQISRYKVKKSQMSARQAVGTYKMASCEVASYFPFFICLSLFSLCMACKPGWPSGSAFPEQRLLRARHLPAGTVPSLVPGCSRL